MRNKSETVVAWKKPLDHIFSLTKLPVRSTVWLNISWMSKATFDHWMFFVVFTMSVWMWRLLKKCDVIKNCQTIKHKSETAPVQNICFAKTWTHNNCFKCTRFWSTLSKYVHSLLIHNKIKRRSLQLLHKNVNS